MTYNETILEYIKKNKGCDTLDCRNAFGDSNQRIDHVYLAVASLIEQNKVRKKSYGMQHRLEATTLA